MKNVFVEPMCEVIRFEQNVIRTSGCVCDVGGYDFGPGANGTPGCSKNNPECTCQDNHNPAIANCV